MSTRGSVAPRTRLNWTVDAIVLGGALLAALSGIYFLFLPVGGYQGGRNPAYNLVILFSRATWEDLHTWGGVAMIIAVAVHFTLHWAWTKMMARRIGTSFVDRQARMSRGALRNALLDLVVAISFLLTAISGIYFLLDPSGHGATGVTFLFTRTTWDLIHTWAAVVLIVAAVAHFAIHWRWIVNVTRRILGRPASRSVTASAAAR